MIKLLLGLIQITLLSCSNISTNQVSKGSFSLYNGHFHGQPLKTQLVFDRFSWFKESTLMYDIRIAPVSEESAYFQWFSSQSQKDVRECPQFYVALLYAKSARYIPHRLVTNQLESQGAEIQAIPDFWRSLKMHPQFERESMQLYRIRGICFKRKKSGFVILGLPGYPSQIILEL